MSALTLDDAKAHLGITNATSDIELQDTIDAAEAAIGNRVGSLSVASRSAVAQGRRATLLLPTVPAVSLTSVTPTTVGSTALTVSDLVLDGEAGTVTYVSGQWFTADAYTVIYTAGWSVVPDDLLYAVKEMTRHLWRTQRGAGGRPGAAGEQVQTPGYLIPYAVAELLEPYMQVGVA